MNNLTNGGYVYSFARLGLQCLQVCVSCRGRGNSNVVSNNQTVALRLLLEKGNLLKGRGKHENK